MKKYRKEKRRWKEDGRDNEKNKGLEKEWEKS